MTRQKHNQSYIPRKKLKEVIQEGKIYPESDIGKYCVLITPPLRVVRGKDERGDWFLAYHPSIEEKVLPYLPVLGRENPRNVVTAEFVSVEAEFSFAPFTRRVHDIRDMNKYRKFVQGIHYSRR